MRIVHIVAHRAKNGVSTSCKTLIEAQLRHGHTVLLITMADSWIAEQEFTAPLEMVFSHLKTRIPELRRVGAIVRAWSPTVVHCHGSKANKYGMVFRLAAGAPVVMTAHSRNIQLPPSFFRAVIAPSQQTADYHNQKNWVRRSKLHVIAHLFDDIVRDAAEGRQHLMQMGVGKDDFVIGIVGSVDHRKNQIDGVRILKKLLADRPSARLVLVGGVSEKHAIDGWHDAIADPAVKDRIVLAGHCDDAQALIAGFDVLLCTSRIEEGPIVVLEAMALNVPVVSTAVGMVPWLIRDGVDGFVSDVGACDHAATAIGTLMDDRAQREKIGRAGRQRLLSQCDEKAILGQIDAVYRSVAVAAGTL